MSLHYGISKHTYDTVKIRVLNYQISYNSINISRDSTPIDLSPGVPTARLYCKGHHPDGGFTILTHRFDEDDNLRHPLTIRLKIRVCLSDGTVELVDLEDVDYFGADMVKCETTYFLEKRYKFKDIAKHGSRDIYAFDILFRQLTGGHYGNESIMDIAVDY